MSEIHDSQKVKNFTFAYTASIVFTTAIFAVYALMINVYSESFKSFIAANSISIGIVLLILFLPFILCSTLIFGYWWKLNIRCNEKNHRYSIFDLLSFKKNNYWECSQCKNECVTAPTVLKIQAVNRYVLTILFSVGFILFFSEIALMPVFLATLFSYLSLSMILIAYFSIKERNLYEFGSLRKNILEFSTIILSIIVFMFFSFAILKSITLK